MQPLLELKSIIEPKAVAIVGASENIEKVGGAITRNAIQSSYRGNLYLVNPSVDSIYQRRSYKSLEEIHGEIDLVEIVVPANIVPSILEQAVNKRVKGAVIVSSGFAEVGNKALEDSVIEIARRGGIRVIGPNCFGIINTAIDLDLTFTFSKALRGSTAFVSQSGAMCCGTLDWARQEGMGFSKFINLGNKCDIDESDVLEYLVEDPQTEVIAMYIEGIKDGRRLFNTLKTVCRRKPVVAIKSGVTEAGARAALSHTGSIAVSDNVVNAAFKQAGVIRVDDVEELLYLPAALSHSLPKGRNVAIISNAGGLAVMAADWCSKLDLKVPKLPLEVAEKVRAFLPPIASHSNPVDMTGGADYECYRDVLSAVLEAKSIDMAIVIFVSQGLVTSDGPARGVTDATRGRGKPVLAYWMGGASVREGIQILKKSDITTYSSPAKTAKAAAALASYSNFKKSLDMHWDL